MVIEHRSIVATENTKTARVLSTDESEAKNGPPDISDIAPASKDVFEGVESQTGNFLEGQTETAERYIGSKSANSTFLANHQTVFVAPRLTAVPNYVLLSLLKPHRAAFESLLEKLHDISLSPDKLEEARLDMLLFLNELLETAEAKSLLSQVATRVQ